jgi:phosphatidate cytidylyltransferase
MMSRELRLRIASAIVLSVVVLAASWYGGVAFRLLASLIALLVYYEWSTMTRLPETDLRGNAWGWFAQICIAINTVFGEPDMAMPLLGGFLVTAMLVVALRKKSWWLPGGILYAGLAGVALSEIRGDDSVGLVAMLFVFAVVWGTDILAYFVGRAIGGPKLAPRISPGKTWSGAIGGTIAGVLAGVGVVWAHFADIGLWIPLVALLLSVCSQIGDLFESFIKRRFGAKDSSHLIPGHGGVMDRVDGLVFACFAAFCLAVCYAAWTGNPVASIGAFLLGL